MDKVFTEENGNYKIDCSKALWATDELHDQYHMAKCLLSDVDWVLETDKRIILVEYKNSNVTRVCKPEAFKPGKDTAINRVVKKFYDSLHYLFLIGKIKSKPEHNQINKHHLPL